MNTAQPLPPHPMREALFGETPEVLTHIYEERCNLAVWQRSLSSEIEQYLDQTITADRRINLKTLFTCQADMDAEIRDTLEKTFPQANGRQALIEDMVQLIQMYECLFEPKMIGIRLATLQQAMCPRFHVDYLPARLVTTYVGSGSQWLEEPAAGLPRIPEQAPEQYQQLSRGDVALLKGDGWFDNEGLGVVHRSPPVETGSNRLFMSLDWAD